VHDIRRDTLNLLKQPRKPAKSPKTSWTLWKKISKN
jgi:type II secretory pathway component PulL